MRGIEGAGDSRTIWRFALAGFSGICVFTNVVGNSVNLIMFTNALKLQKPGLRSLVESFTNLELLRLTGVSIEDKMPQNMANLSSLSYLSLQDCGLHGEFAMEIFQLPNLRHLSIMHNTYLTGYLPEFHWSGQLEELWLWGCNFSGVIPPSLGNLTKLTSLDLSQNNFFGEIPSSIGNLTQLVDLVLFDNHFPGPIPESISSLRNLENLDLFYNSLSGSTLKFDGLLQLKNLVNLQLSLNNLSLVYNNHNATITLPKFESLGLSQCNLIGEFPSFLRGQNDLEFLDLGNNRIEGLVPKWLLNLGTNTLWYLNLANNLLTGFEQPFDHDVLPWNNLHYLLLSFNLLQGSLPIPPSSISTYDVSHNLLTGEIPAMFCKLPSILALALPNNNLKGKLPDCLGIISNSASVIDLETTVSVGTFLKRSRVFVN